MRRLKRYAAGLTALVAAAVLLPACAGGDESQLVIYSGRSEALIRPLIERFSEETGIETEVRYAGSPELAAQLLEEGERTEADVFLSQDAGALGAVQNEQLFGAIPQSDLDKVEARFRSDAGQWVGVSARARVIAYNGNTVPVAELPKSVFEITNPTWRGRVGIAPTNASFQAFVTGMRLVAGEERTARFLSDLKANDPKTYTGNSLVLEAVDNGEIALGLVNHYYLYERQKELGADKVVARNHFLSNGDPGALVNVAGVGILAGSDNQEAAQRFVSFLLDEEAQRYFRDETSEYPIAAGVEPAPGLPPLSTIDSPNVDLSDLESLDRTQVMLREAGLI